MKRVSVSVRWLMGLKKTAEIVENSHDENMVKFLIGYINSLEYILEKDWNRFNKLKKNHEN